MAPRNPSELQRLEEEREALIGVLCGKGPVPYEFAVAYGVSDKGLKSIREAFLRELRNIEEILGIESTPYNSEEFCKNV